MLAVDGGGDQTITFAGGAAMTAQDVADEIAATLTGATASAVVSKLKIESDTTGAASSIEVRPGSTAGLLAALGLTVDTYAGADNDIVAISVV